MRVLFWEATLRCNAYCEFCGSKCGDVSCSDELSKEEICYALRKIAERYDASQIMINVTGGEPLMRKDLTEVMRYAVSLGYRWGLVTNGMLLNAETVSEMKKAELKTVSVSIDGLYETHDSLRGVNGGLGSAIRGLRLLSEADFLETVMVTTVVSRKNINELDGIKQLLKTLPIDTWRISPVDPIGRAADNGELLLGSEQVRMVYDYIASCRREPLPFQTTASCSHYLGRYEFKVRDFPFRCGAGKTVGSILANGDIYVCPNVAKIPNLICGNVRTDDFADVWENRFGYFRSVESMRAGRCAECGYFSSCKGDSLHTRSFDSSQPKFCMLDHGLSPSFVTEACEAKSLDRVIGEIKGNREKISDAWARAQSLSKDIVVITPRALKEIFECFDWGTKERTNEMICALTGRIYRSSEIDEEAFIICVEKAVYLHAPSATEDTLVADGHIKEQAARCPDVEAGRRIHIGYIHSHPNELEISMSLGDFKWHRELYEEDWKKALTIIVNPQKKHIAAYAGPAADHAELHLLGYEELLREIF